MPTKTPDITLIKTRLITAIMHSGSNAIVERDDLDALLEYVERLEKERDSAGWVIKSYENLLKVSDGDTEGR